MLTLLTRNWWLVVLRGVLAILFGIAALVWPNATVLVLVLLFGAYVLIDGIFAAIASIQGRRHYRNWWVLLLEGITGLVIGVLTFIWPGITTLVLVYLIAAWALITGIFEIAAAVALRRELSGEWMLGLSGLLSIALGVIIFLRPEAGVRGIIWVIGLFAILFGILVTVLGFRLRGWRKA